MERNIVHRKCQMDCLLVVVQLCLENITTNKHPFLRWIFLINSLHTRLQQVCTYLANSSFTLNWSFKLKIYHLNLETQILSKSGKIRCHGIKPVNKFHYSNQITGAICKTSGVLYI